MRAVDVVFFKVFVREFYRLNAAFFFLITGLCFGFMSGVEHKALAQFFISSPILLLIPIGIWSIYSVKIMLFNKQVLLKSENEFIFHASLLSTRQQWFAFAKVLCMQLLPAILYGAFLGITAIQSAFVVSVIYIVMSIFILLIITTSFLLYDLKHPDKEKKIWTIKQFLDKHFTKPFPLFFIEWISRKEPAALFGSKFFSGLLIYAATRLYKTDVYDWRLLGIMLTIAFASNLRLIFHYQRFENFHFPVLRNLPIPIYKRLLNFLFVFGIICLPDLAILLKNYPGNLSLLMLLYAIAYSLSMLMVIHSLLYMLNVDLEKFTKVIFVLIMAWIILILFSVPLVVLAIFNFITGAVIFNNYYYKFEFTSVDGE